MDFTTRIWPVRHIGCTNNAECSGSTYFPLERESRLGSRKGVLMYLQITCNSSPRIF